MVYSDAARDALRTRANRARQSGRIKLLVEALESLDYRFQVYPQFGEPIIDLRVETGQILLGTAGMLVVRYAIYEERRLVVVTSPMVLPNSGF